MHAGSSGGAFTQLTVHYMLLHACKFLYFKLSTGLLGNMYFLLRSGGVPEHAVQARASCGALHHHQVRHCRLSIDKNAVEPV